MLRSWISVHLQSMSNLCLPLSSHASAQKRDVLIFVLLQGTFTSAHARSSPSLSFLAEPFPLSPVTAVVAFALTAVASNSARSVPPLLLPFCPLLELHGDRLGKRGGEEKLFGPIQTTVSLSYCENSLAISLSAFKSM